MANNGKRKTRRTTAPPGGNRIRVRGKRLDEIDETKLSLAYWLLAKRLVDDRTDPRLPTEDEVRREATKNDEPQPGAAS